jgi:hypothetical protein
MPKDTPTPPRAKPPGCYDVILLNWQGDPVDGNGKAIHGPCRRENRAARTQPAGGAATGLDYTGFHDL